MKYKSYNNKKRVSLILHSIDRTFQCLWLSTLNICKFWLNSRRAVTENVKD